MTFKFRFEKLKRLKEIVEEKRQKEYFVLMNSYAKSMNMLMDLKNKRDEAIIRKKNLERQGSRFSEFDIIEDYLDGNKRNCIKVIEEIKEKRKMLDIKKIELLEASKEKSIYEKLEERERYKYRLGREIVDINNTDEVAGSYFGRKG